MKRCIIAGSRDFTDYECFKRAVLAVLPEKTEIISGHARGTDSMAELLAEELGWPLRVFPADWKRYGRAAGPIRNRQMAVFAAEEGNGILIAFLKGGSRGTTGMIDIARKYNITSIVYDVEELV